MAANIVSPAQSGRFYGCAAPPGCWRAWRSYSGFQPGQLVAVDLVRVYHAMPYVMRFGVASVADIPLVAYATQRCRASCWPLSSRSQ